MKNDKQTTIEQLNQKIALLQQQGNKPVNSVWNILAQKTKGMTQEEINRVYSTQKVKDAKDKMFAVFNQYFLFEKFKDEFACLAPFKPFADDYSVIDNTSATLQQENEALKKELEELKKKQGVS